MKTEILYSTNCAITIYFKKDCDLASAEFREQFKTLKSAIEMAGFIFSAIYPETTERVVIWDSNTGEILAECTPDCDSGPIEVPEDPLDWNYNEDMGFDPYLGCYTDDC